MKNRYFTGMKVRYHYDDFDGMGNITLTVTKVGPDYIVAEADGIRFRIEEGFNDKNIVE